jgi:hypothetical protein
MKKTLIILLFAIVAVSCQPRQDKSADSPAMAPSSAVVEVVSFHTTNRCFTCNSIENNTRQTISEYFADELDKGIIALQVENVDQNAALARQFQAYGSSLFLKVNKNNKSEIINLTEFAFMNARNADAFKAQLKNRIERYL